MIKAIVTGHSKGLGMGITRALLQRGYPVLGIARNRNVKLDQDFPGLFLQLEMDLVQLDGGQLASLNSSIQDFIASASTIYLVNNAGTVSPVGPLSTQQAGNIHAAVQLNINAPFMLSAMLVQLLSTKQQLGILHVSSGASQSAYPGWSIYCATKAALDMHARAVQQDGLPQVRICSLAPGVIDTDMQAEIRQVDEKLFPNKARFDQLKRENQLTPPEIAGEQLVKYLLSEKFGKLPVDDLRRQG